MNCPRCGKNGFVNIGGKRFCSACGAKVDGAATVTGAASMSDITQSGKPLDLRATAGAKPASAANAKPAGQLHGRQINGAAVLDLRAKSAKAAPAPAKPTAPAIRPKAATPAPKAEIAPAPIPPTTPPPKLAQIEPPAKPAPPATPAKPTSPLIKKFTPDPSITPEISSSLPNAVASHVDAMGAQAATAPPPPSPPQSPALQQALTAAKKSVHTPNVMKISAAVVAIGIMAGIIWMQNSPKLAFHTAASQAGINATLPTYMPSSFHQTGPVAVSPGQLTLSFSSPSAANPLNITQQQSSWDASSLRDNYITRQTDNYLTVQGQGLTIYLYSDQANWVNHGVWYKLSGIASLSREQVLKVAYGL